MIGASFAASSRPYAIAETMRTLGREATVGYHIRASSNPTMILGDPDGEIVAVGNAVDGLKYYEALPNNTYDALVIQAFAYDTYVLADDISSIETLIGLLNQNPANAGCPVYIFQTWAIAAEWDQWPSAGSGSGSSLWRRDYYTALVAALRSAVDNPVYLVPTGDVMYALGVAAEASELTGLAAAADLYVDTQHADAWARQALCHTIVGVLLGRSMVGVRAALTQKYEDPLLYADAETAQTIVDEFATIAWAEILARDTGVSA